MKTILIILFSSIFINANAVSDINVSDESNYNNNFLNIANVVENIGEYDMVIEKGEYSLFRTQNSQININSGCGLVGEMYHYYVLKNGKFHLTVNECNKNSVYDFFREQ